MTCWNLKVKGHCQNKSFYDNALCVKQTNNERMSAKITQTIAS